MKKLNKRGAILITTVIFATGIALALGTFIALSVQTARLSNSSFHFNSALNLAEAGLERAMVAINTGDESWATRTLNGATARTSTFGPFDLGGGTEGYVDVAIFNASTTRPRVVAQGRTSGNLGSSVRKQIEIYLQKRSTFENGLVAKNKVTLSGNNVTVDSYDSEDPTASTDGQYVYAKRNDNGSVASAIVEESTVGAELGNADIWGKVATSGSQIVYKPNGTVLGETSQADGYEKIDPRRVTQDFVGEFAIVEPEETATIKYNSETDITTTESVTVGSKTVNAYVLDGSSTPLVVEMKKIDLSGDEVLLLKGSVTLIVPTYYSGSDSISVTGNAQIQLATDAEVNLFVYGNVKIAGNGISNPTGVPKDLRIFGTNDTLHQDIHLGGNGQLKAAVNAPNANVHLGGGGVSGSVCGSIVGYNITLNGGYPFHYDEALKRLGDDNPMRLGLWRELTSPSELVSF